MAATVIVELTGDERRVLEAYRKAEEADKKLRESTGKTGAAAEAAGREFADAWTKAGKGASAGLDKMLADLRKTGPEGQAAAAAIESHFRETGKAGRKSVGEIIDEIAKIDPEAAKAAEALRVELAQADAKTNFDRSLAELRKINPEAAKAAAAVREKMELADAAVKFDGIIEELKKIDPVAAAEAEKLRAKMKTVPEAGAKSWDSFATSAVGSLKTLAGAYLGAQGVSAAIGVVNDLLEDQGRLIDSAASKQLDLARAQQETIKNLAALTRVQQSELLTTSVGQIASGAGVGDTVSITNALGGAVSGGATEQQAISAVTSAALLNRLTPERIAATSSAAVDFGKATGIDDARANVALLTSTGTQARIEDPQKLAKNLAPALSNAVTTVKGQDSQDATREAAAIFSAFTQATADTQGESSRTATIQFTAELGKFFGDMERQQVEARSKIELIDRKIDKGKDTEKDRADKVLLEAFLRDAKGMSDPATLFGRIGALQEKSGLRDQFFNREFGEAQFKGAFKELADSSSEIAQQVKTAKSVIETDSAGFDRLLESTTGLTPQLRGANIVARVNASSEMRAVSDIEGGTLSQIRDITEKTLQETRQTGFFNRLATFVEETGIRPNAMIGNFGSTAAEEGVANLSRLQMRREGISADGIQASERPLVTQIDAAIAGIRELIVSQADTLSPDSLSNAQADALEQARFYRSAGDQRRESFFTDVANELAAANVAATNRVAAAVERQNALVEQQNALLQQTESNTRPGSPDYDAAFNASLDEQDAR